MVKPCCHDESYLSVGWLVGLRDGSQFGVMPRTCENEGNDQCSHFGLSVNCEQNAKWTVKSYSAS